MAVKNRHALYWHSFFLAVTMSFTEVNTVMPALVLEAGGGEIAVGILTAIMIGLPLVTQLFFAAFLHNRRRKKPFLLLGINLRVLALFAASIGIALFGTASSTIPLVFITMAVFALSGAFAGVSYTEMVGAVVDVSHRHTFFVRRQVATTLGLLVSAVATRFFLGAASFPEGYVFLFGMAGAFLLIATGGFWVLREPENHASGAEVGGKSGGSVLQTIRRAPGMVRSDRNLASLILVANCAALGFTAIPLVTALAHRTYDLNSAMVGTFVMIQIGGMLVANLVWTRLIGRGGFRLVLRVELLLIAALFPVALMAAAVAPLPVFALLYLLTGSIISAHKIGIDAILVQISPDGQRALYAGVFGAANIGAAIMPLLTGVFVRSAGFTAVFLGASVAALAALVPASRIWCGEWYRRR
jgi:MFS family permease